MLKNPYLVLHSTAFETAQEMVRRMTALKFLRAIYCRIRVEPRV